ncbi:hypothetical protein [Mizugakiibacter sediminis]|uniref:hypothetical protein n=1 Tax=Mizugakiibacter sediminis TaxID=1475481 RepID=UPI0011E4D4FE|nr:hypothetical protein [Mizugakiibacter sediminis]
MGVAAEAPPTAISPSAVVAPRASSASKPIAARGEKQRDLLRLAPEHAAIGGNGVASLVRISRFDQAWQA